MNEPTINVPLLRKVLEHITAHPEEHDQGMWARRDYCGTTFCIAGHVAVMEGWKPELPECGETRNFRRGTYRGVADVIAQAALGLSEDQASLMFMSADTVGDLWRLAGEFTDGEIQTPGEMTR